MKKDIATKLVAVMSDITTQLDDSVRMVMDNSEEEEFKKYRRAAGKVMGYIFAEIMTPLFTEYPELTPDGLKKDNTRQPPL